MHPSAARPEIPRSLLGAACFLLLAPALARAGSGGASPAPPPPPATELAAVPASASVRPTGMDGKPHPVHARLLLEQKQVVAGAPVRVGLHLDQDPGWHTYWKSPGDIGQPTEITWTLPDGVTAGPIHYPVPQRFEQDDQVSFGYDDQVLLITDLTVPAGARPGPTVLKAHARWLVCQSTCIPGEADLALPVEIAAGGPPAPGPFAPLFAHYAAQHPVDPLDVKAFGADMALSASAVRPNEKFRAAFLLKPTGAERLAAPGAALWPTFTPIVGGVDWWITGTKLTALPDGGIVAVLDGETFEPERLPTSDRIGGLWQVKVGDTWVRTEVTMPLPWAAAGASVNTDGSPLFALAAGSIGGAGPAGSPGSGGEDAGGGAGPDGPKAAAMSVQAATPASMSLLGNLFFAFVGGLILNVMPCVLPVITLKLYSLVEQTDITKAEQRIAGLAYSGGILASFLALASAIVVLRSVFGLQVDWGFQFQYPPYVAALATVVFAFGLSLFGVFEIPALGAGAAGEATNREGVVGYFFTGVFATLLATPCSAPFLGTAIAYAFGAPTLVLLGIFAMVGLGLAAPFLFIAFVPAAYALLPRPGAWMEGFKQLLGFTLVATTVWLVSVLQSQIGPDRAIGFLAFLVFVAMGAWIFGRWGGLGASGREQLLAAAFATVVATGGGAWFLDLQMAEAAECDDGSVATDLAFDEEIPWQPFSEERVAALAGKPVFIDFTADWCLTCKMNEKAVLETSQVRAAMAELGVVPLKADWTRRDETITNWLRRYGRAGVPFYLVIPARGGEEPILLPEVITQESVIEALRSGAA